MPTAARVLLRRLEEERTRRGASQKDFAKLVGMDPGHYANYKNGRVPWDPYLSTIERIAERLRLGLAYLLSDEPAELSPEKRQVLDLGEEVLRRADGILHSRTKR